MKKMYLIKNQQYGVISYVGSVDPRVLVDWLINQSRLDRCRKISVRLIKNTFRKLLTT